MRGTNCREGNKRASQGTSDVDFTVQNGEKICYISIGKGKGEGPGLKLGDLEIGRRGLCHV